MAGKIISTLDQSKRLLQIEPCFAGAEMDASLFLLTLCCHGKFKARTFLQGIVKGVWGINDLSNTNVTGGCTQSTSLGYSLDCCHEGFEDLERHGLC